MRPSFETDHELPKLPSAGSPGESGESALGSSWSVSKLGRMINSWVPAGSKSRFGIHPIKIETCEMRSRARGECQSWRHRRESIAQWLP